MLLKTNSFDFHRLPPKSERTRLNLFNPPEEEGWYLQPSSSNHRVKKSKSFFKSAIQVFWKWTNSNDFSWWGCIIIIHKFPKHPTDLQGPSTDLRTHEVTNLQGSHAILQSGPLQERRLAGLIWRPEQYEKVHRELDWFTHQVGCKGVKLEWDFETWSGSNSKLWVELIYQLEVMPWTWSNPPPWVEVPLWVEFGLWVEIGLWVIVCTVFSAM